MSDLIPEVNWTDFVKVVKDGKVGDLKSCVVKFNGLPVFTAIIPHGDISTVDFAMTQAEYLAVKTNIVGGKDLIELTGRAVELASV